MTRLFNVNRIGWTDRAGILLKKPNEEYIYLNQIFSFANTGVTWCLKSDLRSSQFKHWHCNFTNEETNSEMSHNSINRDVKHRFGGRN